MGKRNRSITVVQQAKPPTRETSHDEKEMTVVITSTGPRFAIGKVVSENGLNGETCHLSCGEMAALARADIWPHLIRPRDILRVRVVPSRSDRTNWHAVEVVAWGPSCPPTIEGEACRGIYFPYTNGEDDDSVAHYIELDEEDQLRAGITPKAVRRLGLNPNTPLVCWVVDNTNPDFAKDLPYFAKWVRKVAEAKEEAPAVLDLSLAGNGLYQV